jgi:hypothetical protein
MTEKASGKVPVTFAKGLLDDVAELTATSDTWGLAPPSETGSLLAFRSSQRIVWKSHLGSLN